MKTQIIIDLCDAISALIHIDSGPVTKSSGLTSYGMQAKRLTKYMVKIANGLRKDRNVNLGKLNKALEKAGWLDKKFIIVKKVHGACWWNDIKLVDKTDT